MSDISLVLFLIGFIGLVWQAGIGIACLVIISKGGRVTTVGIAPGVLGVILVVLGIFLR